MSVIAPSKFNEEQRILVCKMYAEGMGGTEISRFIKSEWGIDYKPTSVKELAEREKNKPIVKKFRDEWMARVRDVPIANKRVRVEDLEYVRLRVMDLIRSNECENKTQKEEFRNLVKTLNEIIVNAREEMEKKPFLMVGLGDFGDKTDDELIAERDEILRQAERLTQRKPITIDSVTEGTSEPYKAESA